MYNGFMVAGVVAGGVVGWLSGWLAGYLAAVVGAVVEEPMLVAMDARASRGKNMPHLTPWDHLRGY